MHLIAIIVALWLHGRLDGHLPWRDEQRQLRALERIQDAVAGFGLWNGPLGVLVVVLPPVLLVGLMQWLLGDWLLGIIELGLGLVLLVWALGEGRIDRTLDRLDRAIAAGDVDAATEQVRRLAPGVVVPEDPRAQVRVALAGAFQRGGDTVFGALFWFLLLGPVGIVLYRLSYLLWRFSARAAHPGEGFRRHAQWLFLVLAWIPARLTALAFGVAGSLGDAWRGWQQRRTTEADGHRAALQGAGLGALRMPGDDAGLGLDLETWVQEARQLLFRTLLVWLVAVAVLTLAGWIT